MSQAKVDKYKNEKANRKKTNARNKVKRVIARIVAAAALVALVGWGGYSGYQYYEEVIPEIKDTVSDDEIIVSIAPG